MIRVVVFLVGIIFKQKKLRKYHVLVRGVTLKLLTPLWRFGRRMK